VLTADVRALTGSGNYQGLAAGPQGFQPIWTDTRTGSTQVFTANFLLTSGYRNTRCRDASHLSRAAALEEAALAPASWPPIRNAKTWHLRSGTLSVDPACPSRISPKG
jgi:hypothetical protein